jgi:hypothetical protein
VNELSPSKRNRAIVGDYQSLREDLASLLPDSPAPLILIKENVCRSSYRREWREERNEAITPLKAEVAELKGKVDTLLTLLGQRSFKAADVIDLSDWRKDNAA